VWKHFCFTNFLVEQGNAMKDTSFDVFLSYNSEDREDVEKLAALLGDKSGLRPWLDKWQLIPGESWLEGLERGLTSAKACAVFVGKSGQGPWQQREINAALDKQVNLSEFRVIPVLLPTSPEKPELPLFLSGNMWVEFEDLLNDDALWRLECGIKGISPGRGRPELPEDRRSTKSEPVPYVDASALLQPGGAVEVDSRFYIKRGIDEDVFDGINRNRGLVTIRGPRQTGKTSLILKTYVNARGMETRFRPVFVDFQALTQTNFKSLDSVWEAIASEIVYQLFGKGWDPQSWDTAYNYDRNITSFLDRVVFADDKTPVLL
jgi:TIR domain/AAA-like domain